MKSWRSTPEQPGVELPWGTAEVWRLPRPRSVHVWDAPPSTVAISELVKASRKLAKGACVGAVGEPWRQGRKATGCPVSASHGTPCSASPWTCSTRTRGAWGGQGKHCWRLGREQRSGRSGAVAKRVRTRRGRGDLELPTGEAWHELALRQGGMSVFVWAARSLINIDLLGRSLGISILFRVEDEDLLDDYDLVVHPLLGTATYLTDAGQAIYMNSG